MRNSAEARTKQRSKGLLITVCVSQFVVVMDFSIVNVALPAIESHFDASLLEVQWIVSAYALSYCSLLLLGSRLADAFGRTRAFMLAIMGFTIAAALGGIATNPTALIAARAVQGACEAVIAPAGLSILIACFKEGSARNRAFAAYSATGGIAVIAGVVLGGLLTDLLNWRWTMYINIPFGIVVLAAAPFTMPQLPRLPIRSFDLAGTVTVTPAAFLLLFGLTALSEYGVHSRSAWFALAAGIALMFLFVRIESRSSDPILSLDFVRQASIVNANLAALLFGGIAGGNLFVLSQYIQAGMGLDARQTGLLLSMQGFAALFISPFVSGLLDRFGVRVVVISAMVILSVGNTMFVWLLDDEGGWWRLAPGLILTGSGAMLASVGITAAATAGVAGDRQTLAAALVNVAQQFGTPLAIALAVIGASVATDQPFERLGAGIGLCVLLVLGLVAILPARRLAAGISTATDLQASGKGHSR